MLVLALVYLAAIANALPPPPCRNDQSFVFVQTAMLRGKISGTKVSYLGIPFAKPPVGDLRFKEPQPIGARFGYFDHTKFGNSCVQFGSDRVQVGSQESEDCLNLNVVVPRKCGKKGLPVMVYIHGGSLKFGSATNPENDISNIPDDVIGVSINYRLGALGFLPIDDAGVAKNAGLLDQKLALQWVKDNIATFGGDRTKITVVGQSAGAISIGAHLISGNGEQTLFQRAVLLSGAPLVLPPVIAGEKPRMDFIFQASGCDSVDCLRSKTAPELAAALGKLDYQIGVDGNYITRNSFSAQEQNLISKVPLLVHGNRDEGSIFALVGSEEEAKKVRRSSFPMFPEEVHVQFDGLYPFTGPQSGGAFFGDVVFNCPMRKTSETFTRNGVQVFSAFNTHVNKVRPFGNLIPAAIDIGVAHGSELAHFFQIGVDPSEKNLSLQLRDSYFSFVRGKDPLKKEWKPYGAQGNRFNTTSGQLFGDNISKPACDLITPILEQIVAQFA
jgi:para-nitrobenzyl esterase